MDPVEIIPFDIGRIGDVWRSSTEFRIESRLVLRAGPDGIQYDILPIEPRLKHYPPENLDLFNFLDDPEHVIYLAYVNSRLAGQIILHKNWNAYGYIRDIAVDSAFRRMGIGRKLIEKAVTWARGLGLPGLMLETQDVNVTACRLYASCGFILAGFDRYLYRGLEPNSDEIALYWYLTF